MLAVVFIASLFSFPFSRRNTTGREVGVHTNTGIRKPVARLTHTQVREGCSGTPGGGRGLGGGLTPQKLRKARSSTERLQCTYYTNSFACGQVAGSIAYEIPLFTARCVEDRV